jgi:porphyrinogen peroxidase
MLSNMFIGKPPGNYDRILDFSRASTGNLFFVPAADFLDDPPGAASTSTQQAAPESTAPNGSLGIGGLREVLR